MREERGGQPPGNPWIPELLPAIPEHQVPLPGGNRPSQTDVWALVRARSQLLSVAVEGKVQESFGETVADWLR